MIEALQIVQKYELWIYGLLSLGGLVYIYQWLKAENALQRAIFGMERESAQHQRNQSLGMLMVFILLAAAQFILVSIVSPQATSKLALPTGLPMTAALAASLESTPQSSSPELTATPLPTIQASESKCVKGQIEISAPAASTEISGIVDIIGTANIPNFGFYKYEMARPGDALWLTIGAGRKTINDALLGTWDTSNLPSGEYLLRLVIIDNTGKAQPACAHSVFVIPAK